MRRFFVMMASLGLMVSGCTVVFEPGPADPAPIAPTQFLRPVRDEITGTWTAAWVEPEGFIGTQ
ncbi:MAG: hypothetical protein GY778_27110 [bacterium]|nr:hypothetical protein [bacterium]